MSLYSELRNRNVFRVAALYAVVGWLLAQIATTLEEAMLLPDWFDSVAVAFLILGFPISIILAWAFELTPEGIKRQKDVTPGESLTSARARRIDGIMVGLLVMVAALIVWQVTRSGPDSVEPAHDFSNTPSADSDSAADNDIKEASIAVLPFADLSAEGDQEYFGDGIAEEILNVLTRASDLQVASRTSSFKFKGHGSAGIPTIAKELNVRHVLEGSVRKAGSSLRITAQLIDSLDDRHLWSNTFTRELTTENLFDIQEEIAKAIVEELGATIRNENGGQAGAPLRVRADTDSMTAYELFLKGHDLYLNRSFLNLTEAIPVLQASVEADPEFARAWSELAAVYAVSPSWGLTDRNYLDLADSAAQKAIELDPDLTLPYAVQGTLNLSAKPPRWEAARQRFDEVLTRDPAHTDALLWRGAMHLSAGFFNAAESDLMACLARDPAYENCRRFLAVTKLHQGQTEKALELYEKGVLNGSQSQTYAFYHAYARSGNYSALVHLLASSIYQQDHWLLEPVYRALTNPDYDRAMGYQEILLKMKTIENADQAEEFVRDVLGPYVFNEFEGTKAQRYITSYWDPNIPAIRSAPGRKQLIIELGLPGYWREVGFPPQCRPVGEDDFECD